MTIKNFYLLAAIAGAVLPYVFFLDFAAQQGLSLIVFVQALFANGAAAGFTADLVISSLVFWVFMASNKKTSGPKPILFIVLNLCIGLSCALPAYLWAAEAQKR